MAESIDRGGGLIDVHDPGRRAEVYVEATPAPTQQLVPKLGLPLNERAGFLSAVAGEVTLRVARNALGESLLVGGNPVDRRIGEPGQRQGTGVDVVLGP